MCNFLSVGGRYHCISKEFRGIDVLILGLLWIDLPRWMGFGRMVLMISIDEWILE